MANEDNDPLSVLRSLISINSVFPNEAKIASFAAERLRNSGFEVQLQEFAPGRFNVLAQKGPLEGSILLFGHLDTVPPYNYGATSPFEMREEDGRIRGLGCWDMKSGLSLIFLCAAKCVPKSRGIRIVLTADEENISEGTWFALKSGAFSGCSFGLCHEIPDIPSGMAPGTRPPIILGRRGRCVYRFIVKGIGAHGAGTGGVSAVDLGLKLVLALESIPMPSGRTGPCRLFVRKFNSESSSLAVPTDAIIEADVHYIPPFTPESFLQYLQERLGASLSFPQGCSWQAEIPVRKTPYLPAYETSETSPLVQRFLSFYDKGFKSHSIAYGLTVADENVLSTLGIPLVTVGPLGGEAHSSLEWLSKEDFLRLAEEVPKMVQGMLD